MRAGIEDLLKRAHVRQGVSGASRTTFAIGGELEFLVECSAPDQISEIIETLAAEGEEYRVLGAGSNVLIPSGGLAGVTLMLGREFRYCEQQGQSSFRVGGATPLMSISREMCAQGFAGLEFAAGIPGSVGGASFMNAGAHGGQMSNVLRTVRYVTPEGKLEKKAIRELTFQYRSLGLPAGCLIYSVELCLKKEDPGEVCERRRICLEERKRRQPLSLPSAGSVFKNPSPERSAGYLIDHAGLRGLWQGGAQISELHANWIVNPRRQATDSDVLTLMSRCQDEVLQKFSIALEPEIRIWSAPNPGSIAVTAHGR